MKRITVLIVSIALLLSLAACRGGKTENTTAVTTDGTTVTEAPQTTEPVTETDAETADPEEERIDELYGVYRSALGKTSAVDNLNVFVGVREEMKIGEDKDVTPNVVDMSVDAAVERGQSGMNRMLANVEMTATVSGTGSKVSISEYVDGGDVYVKTSPYSGYLKTDSQNELVADIGLKDSFTRESFRGASSEQIDQDGLVYIKLQPQEGTETDVGFLNDIMTSFSVADAKFTDISAEYVICISLDGYLVGIDGDLTFCLEIKGADGAEKSEGKASVALRYSDFGAVSVEAPANLSSAVYAVYDPTIAGSDYTGTLMLYADGSFDNCITITEDADGIVMIFTVTGRGSYERNSGDITMKTEGMDLRVGFDSEEQKKTFVSLMDAAKQMGSIDDDAYNVLMKAISDEGFSGSKAELAELSGIFTVPEGDAVTRCTVDEEAGIAYFAVDGLDLGENEYCILESEFIVTLGADGKCTFYRESTDDEEDGLGEYTAYELYTGTYKNDGMTSTCTLTSQNMRIKYKSDASLAELREYYKQALDQGMLGAAVYDQYMALISEDGYSSEFDQPDVVTLTLEPHTHTAIVVDDGEGS